MWVGGGRVSILVFLKNLILTTVEHCDCGQWNVIVFIVLRFDYFLANYKLHQLLDSGHFSVHVIWCIQSLLGREWGKEVGIQWAKHTKSDLHVVLWDLTNAWLSFSFRTCSLASLWTSSTYHHASNTRYQISYFVQHNRNQHFAVSWVTNGSFHPTHPFLNSIWGLRT